MSKLKGKSRLPPTDNARNSILVHYTTTTYIRPLFERAERHLHYKTANRGNRFKRGRKFQTMWARYQSDIKMSNINSYGGALRYVPLRLATVSQMFHSTVKRRDNESVMDWFFTINMCLWQKEKWLESKPLYTKLRAEINWKLNSLYYWFLYYSQKVISSFF